MKTLAQPKALSHQKEDEGGYHDKNRRHMDRLFENYDTEKN